MKLTIYLDLLIFINIIINYFLIKSTALLCGTQSNTIRFVSSSVIGSLFSVIIIFDLDYIVCIAIKIISLLLCNLIAFRFTNYIRFLKLLICSLIINFGFTGMLQLLFDKSKLVFVNNCFYYIGINPIVFVLSVILFYFFMTVIEYIVPGIKRNEIKNIIVEINNQKLNTIAFYDTGFKVKDIITHHSLALCNIKFLEQVDCPERQTIENYFDGIDTKGYIPVFYSDTSTEGILPGIKANIIYKSKKIEIVLAVTQKEIFDNNQIIIGKEIFELIGD